MNRGDKSIRRRGVSRYGYPLVFRMLADVVPMPMYYYETVMSYNYRYTGILDIAVYRAYKEAEAWCNAMNADFGFSRFSARRDAAGVSILYDGESVFRLEVREVNGRIRGRMEKRRLRDLSRELWGSRVWETVRAVLD